MKEKILFIIDPIHSLNPKKDSSLLMMDAFLRQNKEVYITQLCDIHYSSENHVFGYVQSIIIKPDYSDNADFIQELSSKSATKFDNFSYIFMRKDPPVDDNYLDVCRLLNLLDKSKIKIINPPNYLQIYNEKLFAFQFAQFSPSTIFTSSKQDAYEFACEFEHVILKPIDGMGGKGVFISSKNDANFSVIFETLSANFSKKIIIQEFIPEIKHGDKRILIINGHIFDHALARIPKDGEIRGNLAAGGSYKAIALTDRDKEIATSIANQLIIDDIMICGIDVIGDKLTEINITSPTCFQELTKLTGRNPFDLFFKQR